MSILYSMDKENKRAGWHHTEESKQKIREAAKNRKKPPSISEETRRKLSEAQKGKVVSDETKAKLSEIAKNRPPMSAETRRKLSEAQKGRKHSEETKRKISEANKGRGISDKCRAASAIAHKGKKLSDEHRRKISESQIGRKPTEETRRKLSEAASRQVITEESKRKNSEAHKGKYPSAETRQKLSESQIGRIRLAESKNKMSETSTLNRLGGHGYMIKGYFNSLKTGGLVAYRSKSVELRIMQILETTGYIKHWKYEPVSIEFPTVDGPRHTVPDFFAYTLDGVALCIEGKAIFLVEDYLASQKYEATVKWCEENNYTYILVTDIGLEKGWRVPGF